MVRKHKFTGKSNYNINNLNLCKLPSNYGAITVKELNDLIKNNNIKRSKSNNYLRTKKDKCLALIEKRINVVKDNLLHLDKKNTKVNVDIKSKELAKVKNDTIVEIGNKLNSFSNMIKTSLNKLGTTKEKINDIVSTNKDLNKR